MRPGLRRCRNYRWPDSLSELQWPALEHCSLPFSNASAASSCCVGQPEPIHKSGCAAGETESLQMRCVWFATGHFVPLCSQLQFFRFSCQTLKICTLLHRCFTYFHFSATTCLLSSRISGWANDSSADKETK